MGYSTGILGGYSGENSVDSVTIRYYAPEQPDKKAEYYFDVNFTERVEMSRPIYVENNDTVIHVKWVAM